MPTWQFELCKRLHRRYLLMIQPNKDAPCEAIPWRNCFAVNKRKFINLKACQVYFRCFINNANFICLVWALHPVYEYVYGISLILRTPDIMVYFSHFRQSMGQCLTTTEQVTDVMDSCSKALLFHKPKCVPCLVRSVQNDIGNTRSLGNLII